MKKFSLQNSKFMRLQKTSSIFVSRETAHSSLQATPPTIRPHPRIINSSFSSSTVPPHTPLSSSDFLRLESFIGRSERLFVLCGAGVSTESGIKDYRSENVGLFATTKQRPVNYSDFLNSSNVRQRYWARNTTAWPIFKSFKPNIAHRSLATLEHLGKLHWLVTQNVDDLHHKAGSRQVTELHGTVFSVICLTCRQKLSRDEVQDYIFEINPNWSATPEGFAPDADVFVSEEAVRTFKTPTCRRCSGILKPDVVFFGDVIPKKRVEFVSKRLAECDAMLIAGSSIETYSALRHVKQAKDLRVPVLILNIGRTRADPIADFIINAKCGDALTSVVEKMLKK
ncbi:PREDICTED: NAD-dependent protein lipoamidase sirtuin-4, mitochondrial-like isoform X2 [Amphimedon queenslandica]|uniref:Deacetylase sirtuin-type domain-containing protein n=1 Tax=Amphimedon queenslandica TaxID=400682 RepID=A0A1X7V0C3_AMPQE|nr:PREDICTED: NAD-dependent protein lipoamidase sirtuin-4, mitochondrial-like isoform X2 [Amphimedon queenslandica]|eukprot:XP_011403504.2 PREDICTED: NAD-dependent protein lipoamidase sirtuin-4, mitochondrial-like isoform X2 [Amphimedon queenslandica]